MDATTKITKNLGGDRLGSGNKNNISLHAYNRSTHDLSRAWRSTMGCGTLVPFMKEVALPGDTFSIDLEAVVRTLPTIGPMYGSYKLQLDVFECPMRLYNGLLHNNMTKIGMSMEKVKIPQITLTGLAYKAGEITTRGGNYQINNTSLMKYLGVSGIMDAKNFAAGQLEEKVNRNVNAIPLLAYWDIYKNYYANKQEEKGVVIGSKETALASSIEYIEGINTGEYTTKTNSESTLPAGITAWNNYQELNNPYVLTNETNNLFFKTNGSVTNLIKLVLQYGGTYYQVDLTSIFMETGTDGEFIWGSGNVHNYDGYEIVGIQYIPIPVATTEIQLQEFPLENIDNARIKILRDTGLNNRTVIDNLWDLPYSLPTYVTSNNESANVAPCYGLGVKTYQSDLFENWMKTEWIDGVGGINEITAVDTSSGSFQIDALNLANKVYNMLNRIAVSGGSYEDYIEAVYSTEANRRPESPVYKGGMSSEIVFEEVVSTAQQDNQPLGTLGGKGTVTNKRGGHIEIRVNEPSYIMGIVSITPRVDYSQGNDWDMTELDTMADLHKPALDGIGFEDLLQERMAWFGTYWDISSQTLVRMAAGKVPAWINYMTSVNKTFGEFAADGGQNFMCLNRIYKSPEDDLNAGIQDLTTYVNPALYNDNFAESNLASQNFWVQIGAKIEARRVMSAKIIPNL